MPTPPLKCCSAYSMSCGFHCSTPRGLPASDVEKISRSARQPQLNTTSSLVQAVGITDEQYFQIDIPAVKDNDNTYGVESIGPSMDFESIGPSGTISSPVHVSASKGLASVPISHCTAESDMDDGARKLRMGYATHRTVPKQNWCVTYEDLRKLRSLVKDMVRKGEIAPTDRDNFAADDDKVGPGIHTVVTQLIKPATLDAGGLSWALMEHPDGLPCDLFVTHCWKEGTYELIDKVLHAWPKGARTAYCCMLSNPQNLNIQEFISCPGDSPFACALMNSSHMLVVPNSKCSIYSRIWCVYEAYLAYKWEKTIYVAAGRIDYFWRSIFFDICILGLSLLFVLLVPFEWGCSSCKAYQFLSMVLFFSLVVLALLTTILPPGRILQLVNCASLFISSLCLRSSLRSCIGPQIKLLYSTLFVGSVIFFLCSDADRMYREQFDRAKAYLSLGFTGKVRDAQASREEDAIEIWRELNGREAEVDNAIAVLLRSGMSTPHLRRAAKLGVNVESAGMFRVSLMWLGFLFWCWYGFAGILQEMLAFKVLGTLIVMQSTGWICLWLTLPIDNRAFAAAVVFKLMFIGFGLGWLPTVLILDVQVWNEDLVSILDKTLPVLLPWIICLGFLTLWLSAAGLGRVTAAPRVGPWLAQALLASNWKAYYKLLFGCCRPPETIQSLGHARSLQWDEDQLPHVPDIHVPDIFNLSEISKRPINSDEKDNVASSQSQLPA